MGSEIWIGNEYKELREVVVGTAEKIYIPGPHRIEQENEVKQWKKLLSKYAYGIFQGKMLPNILTERFRKEEEKLVEVLSSYGVKVYRTESVEPIKGEEKGLGQMFARDSCICIGEKFINGNLQIEMRRKELRGFAAINEQVIRNNGKLYKIEPDSAIYLEGGDVLVDLPYVYVGIGKYASNMEGVKWLERVLGEDIKVIPVELAYEGILHLDCCMTLIGPGKGIICKECVKRLPEPLMNYNFIEVDRRIQSELGTNILMLNPETIILQKRHEELRKELERRKFKTEPIDFTWHAMLDGAFRCATVPLRRD